MKNLPSYPLSLPRRFSATQSTYKSPAAMLVGACAGAALMYICDPQQGSRRRALIRDQLRRGLHAGCERTAAAVKDLRHRSQGLMARGRRGLQHELVADDVLQAQARSRLGHVVDYAHAIDIAVQDGRVRLTGPILSRDLTELLRQIRRLPGVQHIDNQLEVHDEPGNVPALQGALAESESNDAWRVTPEALACAAGSTLMAGGFARMGKRAMALGALSLGLLAVGALAKPRYRRTGREAAGPATHTE